MKSLSRSYSVDCCVKHNLRPGPKLAALILALWSFAAHADWLSDIRPMMGTEVSVYLWCDDPKEGRLAVSAVFQEAARIDRLMSTYRDDSEISKINRQAALQPVRTSDELFRLVERALEISKLTNGAFDISFDSVGQHYDFRLQQRPDARTIESERENIDFRLVVLNDATNSIRFLKQGVRINLGGIAKGYVVERAIALLSARGVRNAIVTAGGDSRLLGDRLGRPWIVGIRDPRRDGEVSISLPLQDEAVSTSGDYERYFDEDGTRYHHIIHPATGKPASGVHSATVIGPDAVTTDALSTSVFVLGVDKGLRLIATLAEYESVVIDADGQVYFSDGLAQPNSEQDP